MEKDPLLVPPLHYWHDGADISVWRTHENLLLGRACSSNGYCQRMLTRTLRANVLSVAEGKLFVRLQQYRMRVNHNRWLPDREVKVHATNSSTTDNNFMSPPFRRAICIVLALSFSSGCTVFKGSREIDPAPFSDNTTIMFGNAVTVSRPFQFKYLKAYDVAEHDKISAAGIPLKSALAGIVYYSNQVIAINNSKLSPNQKNEELAQYIHAALEKAVQGRDTVNLRMNQSDIQATLQEIRGAPTFLDGLAAATPIVHAVVTALHERLDEIQDLVPVVIAGYEREIEREFGVTRRNFADLLDIREKLMHSLGQLYRARLGDMSELDQVLQENTSLRSYFKAGRQPTPDQFADAEQFLMSQLDNIDRMLRHMDETKDEYHAKQLELIEWQTHVDDRLRVARTSITVWAQSHRNLGAGIPVPPLLDISELATEALGLIK